MTGVVGEREGRGEPEYLRRRHQWRWVTSQHRELERMTAREEQEPRRVTACREMVFRIVAGGAGLNTDDFCGEGI